MFVKRTKRLSIALLWLLMLTLLSACHSGEHHAGARQAVNQEDHNPSIDQERLKQLQVLDETADRMYQEVLAGNILEARELMKSIGDQVVGMEYTGITTVEGLEALTQAITNARRLMNAVQTEPDRLKSAAAQVRLSTDALLHKHQPLWFEYYQTLRADTEQLKQAVQSGQNIIMSAQQLHHHYTVIRPAVLISRSPEINVKIESLIAYFMQQASSQNEALLMNVDELMRTWNELFGKQDVSAYLPVDAERQPIYWSLVIGSIIITVLCFVAWRKYESEQQLITVSGGGHRNER